MSTTDDFSPINKALGIPERYRFPEVVAGTVFECLTCQECSPIANNLDPTDFVAQVWAIEHAKQHNGRTEFFMWQVVRTRVSMTI